MKKFYVFFFYTLLLAWIPLIQVQGAEVIQNKKGSYRATASSVLQIDNRFGLIRIESWPVGEISVMVEIKARAASEKRAEEILDRIRVDLGSSGSTVYGRTRLDNINTRNGESFSIDYTVRVPVHLKMDIRNEFGDTYINVPCAESEFSNRFGTLYLQTQTRPVRIKVEHGAARLQHLADLFLELQHSRMDAGNIETARIRIEHSTANLGDGKEWDVYVRHSNVRIGSLQRIQLDNEFSPFQAESITQRFASIIRHSSIRINVMGKDFEEFNVDAQHSQVTLALPSDAAFRIDAMAHFGGIDLGQHRLLGSLPQERADGQDQFTQVARGVSGGPQANSRIYFRGEHSQLSLR